MAGLALGRGKAGVIRADVRKLDIAELPPMGQELQRGTLEFGMALAAVLLVVAAGAGLRVVQRLQGMDLQPVTAVALGDIIPSIIVGRELRVDAAPLVTVEAVGLVMAFGAVFFALAGEDPMPPQPVCIVIEGNPFRFMAAVALADFH